jgi:hypothetical protein
MSDTTNGPVNPDYLENIPYEDIVDTLFAIVTDRPPWNDDAAQWCVSHGLITLYTQEPPSNFQYYELTEVGSRIYQSLLSHFTTILDAHYDSGQLKTATQTPRSTKWDDLWK